MPSFEIPTGPSISKRGTTYLVSDVKLCCGKHPTITAPYGSITYDHKKGTMPLDWENEDKFLVCLAAEEHVKTIKFIVSVKEQLSDSPNWWAWCTYWCLQEFWGHGMLCGAFPFIVTYLTSGVPVMWMLSLNGMEATINFSLNFIKMCSPEITPQITMSDCDQAQMNAIKV